MRGLLLFLLLGCETMDAPGNPFDPVEDRAETPVTANGSTLAEPDAETPSNSDAEQPAEEQLARQTDVGQDDQSDSNNSDPSGGPEATHETPAQPSSCLDDELDVSDLELLSACDPSESPALQLSGSLWLEKTYDERDEGPTAVVVLDTGERVYAKVGTMFPTLGIVVMGIGDQRIQMAQIRPSVDGSEATLIIQNLASKK